MCHFIYYNHEISLWISVEDSRNIGNISKMDIVSAKAQICVHKENILKYVSDGSQVLEKYRLALEKTSASLHSIRKTEEKLLDSLENNISNNHIENRKICNNCYICISSCMKIVPIPNLYIQPSKIQNICFKRFLEYQY